MQSLPRRRTCGIPLHHLLRLLQLRFASASPQNQLHLAECTCRKKVAWWAARCHAGLDLKTPPTHQSAGASTKPLVGYLFYFLLLTRYTTANNPAIANIASNPGTPSSGVGDGIVGDGLSRVSR